MSDLRVVSAESRTEELCGELRGAGNALLGPWNGCGAAGTARFNAQLRPLSRLRVCEARQLLHRREQRRRSREAEQNRCKPC